MIVLVLLKSSNLRMPHLAPKGCRRNDDFTSITLTGEFAYCESHNFIFNPTVEEEKLYNGQPCYYTDNRFVSGDWNSFMVAKLYWKRRNPISLKSCIRRTLRCRNIPVGTEITFGKSYYFVDLKVENSFKFKVKKVNEFEPIYEINKPSFANNFKTASNELVERLRNEGFLVSVWNENPNFLIGEESGELAIAYGFGKIIGFSTETNSFRGYQNGRENILWDKFGNFDKWSRCNEISKNTPIDEIIFKLKFG